MRMIPPVINVALFASEAYYRDFRAEFKILGPF